MKTIALCMIVKNEEEYLRRCLDSVRDKVNQIVIVDTGSTDETVSIAKEYTNEVYHFEWVNDFAAARNESIRYARTDYILVLDADEYLENSVNILECIQPEADYYFTRIHNIMSQGRAINHLAIRFFANNKGLHYRNRLHEHLNTYEDEEKYKAGHAKFTIMHTGYTNDMLEGRDKSKRNLSLMLKEVEENPTVYNLFNMGRTYNWTGNHEKAIEYLQRAYTLSKNLSIVPELVTTLCRSLGEMKRYESALYVLQEAVVVFPTEVDLVHLQAMYFKEYGYYKDAIAKMNRCLEIGDQGITVTEGNGSYVAHIRLAEWYESRNNLSKSYEHVLEAIELNRNFVPILAKYFQIVTKANVPLEDVFNSFQKVFSISSSEELQTLLEILYSLRNPLLLRYLNEYEVSVQDNNVMAVAHQYAKEYLEAKSFWLEMIETLTEQNGEDILLLSIILNDEELFSLTKPLINLSSNERKILLQIVRKNSIESMKLTTVIENILEQILVRLIQLQEFEIFEFVLGSLWQGSMQFKYKVCEHIISYGFNEIAIDLLLKLFEQHPKDVKIIALLGDACFNSNYLQDAQLFYAKLLEICDDYSVYEKAYDFYERIEDESAKNNILTQIKRNFPLCSWVEQGS
jgi:glycosyltransferase involved in cell wall biosynthesis